MVLVVDKVMQQGIGGNLLRATVPQPQEHEFYHYTDSVYVRKP